MNIAAEDLRRRNRRLLGLLAALFFVPVALAFLLYYGTPWRPPQLVNHGALIRPPRPLPAIVPLPGAGKGLFRGKWSLVYVGDGRCDAACRWALLVMRQTRLGLNTDMTRVVRVLLATGVCCDRAFLNAQHPGLIIVDATGPKAVPLLKLFPAAAQAHSVYVVDPLGNLMMRYDTNFNPHGLLEDLQQLLRLSHIG